MTDTPALDLPQLRAVVAGLAQIDWDVDDTTRIDLLDALERVKNAAAGAQALGACALDDATRRKDAAAGIASRLCGRGVAAQVGLARSESHYSGQVHLGLAKNLRAELPNTL
ncbi:MAG TPA: HNH endonuclease, partial [Aldersonia sp.]